MVNRKKMAHAWKLLFTPSIMVQKKGEIQKKISTQKQAIHTTNQSILQVKVAFRWIHAVLMGALKEYVWGRNQPCVKSFLMNYWCSCISLAAIATSERHCLNKPKAAALGTRHEMLQGFSEHSPLLLLKYQWQSWRDGEVIFCSHEVV